MTLFLTGGRKEINEVEKKLEHGVVTKWVKFFLSVLSGITSNAFQQHRVEVKCLRNRETFSNLSPLIPLLFYKTRVILLKVKVSECFPE